MSRNRLEEIMARRNLHKQRLAAVVAPNSLTSTPASAPPLTPVIPLTPVVNFPVPSVATTAASTARSPRKQPSQSPTLHLDDEDQKPMSKSSSSKQRVAPAAQLVATKPSAPTTPVVVPSTPVAKSRVVAQKYEEPEEYDDNELEFSDNDQHSEHSEDFEDDEEEDIFEASPPTSSNSKNRSTVSAVAAEPARRPSSQRSERVDPQVSSEDAVEASTNALPRASLTKLLKTAGFGFSQTVLEAAIEIMQEIVGECIRDRSVTTSEDVNRLVGKHFAHGEEDLPEKTVLSESYFSKFVNPLFQARGATCKRDAFFMLHLFCEGFILKMMRAADMVAGNSRRSLIQANDLTIAYNIYSM